MSKVKVGVKVTLFYTIKEQIFGTQRLKSDVNNKVWNLGED